MRSIWLFLFFTLSAGSAEPPKENPGRLEFVVGISPFLNKGVKDEVYRGLVRLLVENLPLNSTISIYDAFELKSITQLNLPDNRAFSSPKTRANQFAGAVQTLRGFLAQDHPKPTNAHLSFDAAIRLPQFCDFLEDNLRGTNAPLRVLLIGSPLYQDAKEPAFSMVDGYFPSDGHLQVSCERSVFGLRTNSLRGLDIHWVYLGDPWLSDLHKEKVTRFWELFLEQRGARLLTFCGDLPTAFHAFCERKEAEPAYLHRWTVDRQQTKVEMLRVNRNVDLIDWITRDTLPETDVRRPSTMIGQLKIGIRWKANIDLDLYATPHHGAETLYFEHPRSTEGYYYKDHRSSPGREFEFVEFEQPVDIREVQASVNFYQGACPDGPRGEVRIEFDGRIYSAPFFVPASQGNLGRTGRTQQQFWTRLPIQEIVRIQTTSAATGLTR
jgi:hypothetical protein